MNVFDARIYLKALRALTAAGVVAPIRPDRLARGLIGTWQVGAGPAALVCFAAARWPQAPALIDDRGITTYAQFAQRARTIGSALAEDFGVGPDRRIAIMCRNHAGFAEALMAGSAIGADVLLLNTDFPGPQLSQVLEREAPGVIIHDEEFAAIIDASGFVGSRVVAWYEGTVDRPTLDELAQPRGGRLNASRRVGNLTILTSGTTGVPKGAPRAPSPTAFVGPAVALLSGTRARVRETYVVGPPLFHGFGLGSMLLAFLVGGTVVLRRRFDPLVALEDAAHHRAATMSAVPVMLRRMLDVESEHLDTSSLRAVVSGAAPLSPTLATEFMDRFGEVLFNGYGSSEAGIATLALPGDLRSDPGTVGRPVLGTPVKILGEGGRELPVGETGHIFVGGAGQSDGYTGGGSKQVRDGMLNTGDLGHLTSAGRLHIDGREDDMIVSGGENVFPGEVEDMLAVHPGVSDVVVVAVPDDEFGQRLAAYVVASGNRPSDAELKSHVRANLARYKVPREFHFLDELPRTSTGKVLRKKLHAAKASPESSPTSKPSTAPRA